MDFNEMSWQRGDLSFVFNGENQHSGKMFCMWLKVTVLNTLTCMYIFLRPVFCEYKVLLVFKFNCSSVLLSNIHYPLSAEELLCVFIHWFTCIINFFDVFCCMKATFKCVLFRIQLLMFYTVLHCPVHPTQIKTSSWS